MKEIHRVESQMRDLLQGVSQVGSHWVAVPQVTSHKVKAPQVKSHRVELREVKRRKTEHHLRRVELHKVQFQVQSPFVKLQVE